MNEELRTGPPQGRHPLTGALTDDYDREGNPVTKIVKVTIDLTDAWQVWRARVPANTTEAEVLRMYESGELDIELFDSGHSSEAITDIALEY